MKNFKDKPVQGSFEAVWDATIRDRLRQVFSDQDISTHTASGEAKPGMSISDLVRSINVAKNLSRMMVGKIVLSDIESIKGLVLVVQEEDMRVALMNKDDFQKFSHDTRDNPTKINVVHDEAFAEKIIDKALEDLRRMK